MIDIIQTALEGILLTIAILQHLELGSVKRKLKETRSQLILLLKVTRPYD